MVLVPLLMLPLAACAGGDNASLSTNASAPSAGNWRIHKRVDRISGTPVAAAELTTFVNNSKKQFSHNGILQLLCFDKQPVVRLAFDLRVGANRSAVLEYRFDEKPGRKADGRFLPDYRTFVIDEKAEVAKFLDELGTSKVLFVRISSLSAGRTAAEFRVPGAPVAIEAVYGACPVSPPQRRRSA
jgi:hypothetical protein